MCRQRWCLQRQLVRRALSLLGAQAAWIRWSLCATNKLQENVRREILMMWVRRFWLRLQGLFRRNRNDQRLSDEIQFHLDQQIAENAAAGMNPQEARFAAMRTFGNSTLFKE